jgi:hypothetical protein
MQIQIMLLNVAAVVAFALVHSVCKWLYYLFIQKYSDGSPTPAPAYSNCIGATPDMVGKTFYI